MLDIAVNGKVLMQKLADLKNAPDIIFLDMNMPVKNGIECLCEIRNSERLKDVPVVILSTSIASNLLDSACKNGASLYVQKPTSFSNLVDVIERSLALRGNTADTFNLDQFLIKNNTP